MKIDIIIKHISLFALSLLMVSCADEKVLPDEKIVISDKLSFETKQSEYKMKPADVDWSSAESRIISSDSQPTLPPTNAWGGRIDKGASDIEGTEGFFRLGKVGNRWVFVDPDNGVNIIRGTQNVRPGTTSFYTSRFQSDEKWSIETAQLLKDNNINCLDYGGVRPAEIPDNLKGNLLNPEPEVKNNYNVILYILRSYMWDESKKLDWAFDETSGIHNRLNFIFEPTFATYLDEEIKRLCALFVNDPHLLGYQLDNELGFRAWDDRHGRDGVLLNKFLLLDTKAAAQQYAEDFVTEFGLNREDVLKVGKTADIEKYGLVDAFDEFRSRVAKKYYQMYHVAIKKYDPNHLILGSRLHGLGKSDKQTLSACAQYCDVVTINYYNEWTPSPDFMRDITAYTGDRPFLITEFYTKGADANYQGTLYNNISGGGGWVVPTQTDRSYFYQNFCIGLIEAKNCVGWTQFSYDDVFTSIAEDNCNRGLISGEYYPYPEFLNGVNRINRNVYVIADHFDK